MQKRDALAAQLNELEARERAGQEKVAALTANLEDLRQQRDSANTALTESKVALAAEEQLAGLVPAAAAGAGAADPAN